MDNYVELKTYISSRIYGTVPLTDEDSINALEIVKVVEKDMADIIKLQELAKSIEKEENSKNILKALRNKLAHSNIVRETVTINFESANGESRVVIGFPKDGMVCLFKSIGDYDLFLQGENVQNKERFDYVKEIVISHYEEFTYIVNSLNYYTRKYNLDIINNHVVSKESKKSIVQVIKEFPFIMEVSIEGNFQVKASTRFEKEVDPKNLLEEEIAKRIPLKYYINKNRDSFIKRFSIPRKELNNNLDADFNEIRIRAK